MYVWNRQYNYIVNVNCHANDDTLQVPVSEDQRIDMINESGLGQAKLQRLYERYNLGDMPNRFIMAIGYFSSPSINYYDLIGVDDVFEVLTIAMNQWEVYAFKYSPTGVNLSGEKAYCCCSHYIKNLYYFRNFVNGNILLIGSDCIEKFKNKTRMTETLKFMKRIIRKCCEEDCTNRVPRNVLVNGRCPSCNPNGNVSHVCVSCFRFHSGETNMCSNCAFVIVREIHDSGSYRFQVTEVRGTLPEFIAAIRTYPRCVLCRSKFHPFLNLRTNANSTHCINCTIYFEQRVINAERARRADEQQRLREESEERARTENLARVARTREERLAKDKKDKLEREKREKETLARDKERWAAENEKYEKKQQEIYEKWMRAKEQEQEERRIRAEKEREEELRQEQSNEKSRCHHTFDAAVEASQRDRELIRRRRAEYEG